MSRPRRRGPERPAEALPTGLAPLAALSDPAQAAHRAARRGPHHDLRLPWEPAARSDRLQGRRQHHGQLQVLVQVHQQSVHDLHPHLHAPGGRRVKRAGGDKPGKPRRNCNLSTARTLRWLDLAAGGGAACVPSGPEAQNGRVVGCRSTLKMAGAGF